MSYIKPHNAIGSSELLHSPTEKAVYDALATKQPTGNYITQLTGEITAIGPGSVSATISNNAVTNVKLAQVAYGTFKGRKTTGTGNVEDLTQADATALLNTFTSTLQGLVPASGGGTSNYLRADGTWATISIPASANQSLSNLISPTAINQVLLGLNGTAAAPAYSFTNSSSTGVYLSAINTLNFSTNSTNRLQIESDGKIKIIGTSGANLLWNTDGGGDIGTLSSGGRPDNVYVKTNINLSSLTASSFVGSDASNNLVSLNAATSTSYLNNFVGDSGSGGTKGLVPAPAAGDAAAFKFLKADGTWADVAAGDAANRFLSNLQSPTSINQSLLFSADGTLDIGASAASRPNNVYVANSMVVNGITMSLGAGSVASNIGIGSGSLAANTSGSNSIALGRNSLASQLTSAQNVGIGESAGRYVTSQQSIMIGSSALAGTATTAVTGGASVVIGTVAGQYVSTAANLVAIGYAAVQGQSGTPVTGNNSTAIGSGAARYASTAGNFVAVGNGSLQGQPTGPVTGSFNVAIGAGSGNFITSGASNTAVGLSTIGGTSTVAVTGSANSALGASAGQYISTASNTVAVGSSALQGTTSTAVTGSGAVAVGQASAQYLSTATGTVAVGQTALQGQSTIPMSGNGNTAVGASAGRYVSTGASNLALGNSALVGAVANPVTGSSNVVVGNSAGTGLISGSGNVFLGYSSGYYSTTQSNELFIDNQTRTNYATQQSNSLIYGTFNATPSSQTLKLNAAVTATYGLTTTSIVHNGATSGAFTENVPATITSYAVTWPSAQGGASTYLQNDGSGNLSWAAVSGGANTSLSNLVAPTAINVQLRSPNGSAASPSYSFTNNTNTGIYADATSLYIVSGGQQMFQMTSGDIYCSKNFRFDAQIFGMQSKQVQIGGWTFGATGQLIPNVDATTYSQRYYALGRTGDSQNLSRPYRVDAGRKITVGKKFGSSSFAVYGATIAATQTDDITTSFTTTANNSTTITANTGDGIQSLIDIGDYIQLNGLPGIGRVTNFTTSYPNSTFTVDTPLGDGTSRAIIAKQAVASFRKNDSTEVMLIDLNGNVNVSNAQLQVATVGYGLSVKGGSDAKIGIATFSGVSSVTVNTTAVTANSIILVTNQSGGYAPMCVNNIVAGTSFDIQHNNSFTGTVAWFIVEKT
jgi:hypothetical protein